MKLYRGSRQSQRILAPQPIPPGDRERFPKGVDAVVFATEDRTEAQMYAIFRGVVNGPYLAGKDEKDKWHISVPLSKQELSAMLRDKVYVYELSPDGFEKALQGDEWYSTTAVVPDSKKEQTVGDILREWQIEGKVEIHFQKSESEFPRTKG